MLSKVLIATFATVFVSGTKTCDNTQNSNKCSDNTPCLHQNFGDNTCHAKINYGSGVTGCPAGTFYCPLSGDNNGCGTKDCSYPSCIHNNDDTCFPNLNGQCPPGTHVCECVIEEPTCAVVADHWNGQMKIINLDGSIINSFNIDVNDNWQGTLALDRETSTLYSFGINTGNLYSTDISTGNHQLLGNVGSNFFGAYFNCYDGLIYAVTALNGDNNVYTINPNTLQINSIGQTDGTTLYTSILVSKDNTKIYVFDHIDLYLYEYNINNISPGNSITHNIQAFPGNEYGHSIDWFNTNLNDNNIVVSFWQGSQYEVHKYDISNGNIQQLFVAQNYGVYGIELIYGVDCNNLPSIGQVMPNICDGCSNTQQTTTQPQTTVSITTIVQTTTTATPIKECSNVAYINKCNDNSPCLHENIGDNTCHNKQNYGYDFVNNKYVKGCPAGTIYCTKNNNPLGCGKKDCCQGSCVHNVNNDESCFAKNHITNQCPSGTTECQ